MTITESDFEKISKKKILVIGDLILDRYYMGLVSRISPEAPVPIVDVHQVVYKLGGAANVAHNIASLGAKVDIMGVVGKDWIGEEFLNQLQAREISTRLVYKDPDRPTTVKTRVLAHNQQMLRIDQECKMDIPAQSMINEYTSLLMSIQDPYDAVIISDYGKGTITNSLLSWVATKFEHLPIFIDTKRLPIYKTLNNWNTTYTPNILEASRALGEDIKNEDREVEISGIKLMEELKCDSLLITRGDRGMTLFIKPLPPLVKNKPIHIRTVAKQVYDVTGAGDTVIAVFALFSLVLLRSAAAVIANTAAGIVVGEVGTAVVTKEQLLRTKVRW